MNTLRNVSTLVQYYQYIIKQMGYNSWNHYCAVAPEQEREALKKLLKEYFNKEIKNKERQKRWRDKQRELKNVRKK